MTTRDGIHHACRMDDHIEPEAPRHLLLGDVGPSHMDHYFPMGLNEPVGRLAFCRSGNNVGAVVDKVLADGGTKKFAIAVAIETTGKRSGRCAKLTNGRMNIRRRETLKTKGPVIASSAIDQDQRVLESADPNTVTKGDVHVDGVKIFILCFVEQSTPIGLRNCGIYAEREWKLPTIDPFAVATNLKDVFIVPKLTAPHDAVEFLQ